MSHPHEAFGVTYIVLVHGGFVDGSVHVSQPQAVAPFIQSASVGAAVLEGALR